MPKSFFIALQFLTRLPVKPSEQIYSEAELGRSILYYPLVGLLIGLLLFLLSTVLPDDMPTTLGAVLLIGAWVLLTGALHLDGLADSADAWLGGHGNKEKTLAIMRDPASGPAGVIALVMVLLAKYAALQEILLNGDTTHLLYIPIFARTAVIALFLTTPYIRQGGLGEAISHGMNRQHALLVLGVTLLILFVQTEFLIVLLSIMVFAGLRWLMLVRLNGTTGDTCGALIEILEAVLLSYTAIGLG